ncbi:MAG: S-layer homology domain-containing protein [Flintibacter sp.]|uniref:S-layer homology domain-containing protein n=1 Tax=Flintibacter sp. TaxID=1918624 RepID=UPI002D7E46E9|nr:S-layer homology domain-containing protein [Flintibacter sp.]MCI7159156.1 S-layer homology domain-containing protein [Flintibacter sp.]
MIEGTTPPPDPGDGGGTGSRDDYTLHYVTNGGNHLSSETKSSSWTKDYEDLPTPVRDGYTFEGWYWDLRLTEPVTGDVKVDKTTVTLYAKWSGGSYGPDDTGVSKWLETDEHNAFLSGYPDGSFQADKNMTRAEVAQMFYSLLLDKNVTITKSFSDVPTDAWYAKAVNTLSSLGMLGGYPDGTFRPDAPITRAEFAAIALAFAYDPASASCSYTDVSANAWYYTYVAQATTYGWIGGYPDGSFRPNNSITRAEVAVIVNNMLGRDADESYINRNADELVSFVDLSKTHWAYYTIMESTNSHDYTASSNGESWKA